MNRISNSITNLLYEQGIIQDEDVSKCNYGLDIFISSIIEVLSILTISAFMNLFVQTVLFFLAFIPLRIYAGGYHAQTRFRCFHVSFMVYGVFAVIIKLSPVEYYLFLEILLTLFSLIITMFCAPIIHRNKHINSIERKFYRNMSLKICFAETALIMIFAIMTPENIYTFIISLGQTAVTMSMLIAFIKNNLSNNK